MLQKIHMPHIKGIGNSVQFGAVVTTHSDLQMNHYFITVNITHFPICLPGENYSVTVSFYSNSLSKTLARIAWKPKDGQVIKN